MNYSVFLASYVIALADPPRRDRMHGEEQYLLDNTDSETRDLLRRAVIAVAIISLSFCGLAVVSGADMGASQTAVLAS
ncbi:hypothetical protein [Devosia nitrariae]|uniref:Uncharacterized protein n=1 Tax=Devosia nitrariae TaxID=2071872 RepID=A0ABQ5W677_9HYPH|nr:hypothetical protein [Devosia nitrariae]GLQ55446.1 hypothetical protein GCM10010862_27050 [Devosia nitrariae]